MATDDGLYRLKNVGSGFYLKKSAMNEAPILTAEDESSIWAICDVSPTEETRLYLIEEYAGDVFAALRCDPSNGMVALDDFIPRLPAPSTYTWSIDFNDSEQHDENVLVIGAAGGTGDKKWLFAGAVNYNVGAINTLPQSLYPYWWWIAEPVA